MYLPLELWDAIKQHMAPKCWAKACGISRATFALRRRIGAAEVCSDRGNDGHMQVFIRHLRHDRWQDCHSLFLDMRQLDKAARVTEAQIKRVLSADKALPNLQCLHIIGRDSLPLTKESIEGELVRLLARHVLVLTLQISTLATPLDLLFLQHLVLDIDTGPQCRSWDHRALFPALNQLKGLRSLYVQGKEEGVCLWGMSERIELRGCVHLQHMAVQGIAFQFANHVALPDGCTFHVMCRPSESGMFVFTYGISDAITGLVLRYSSPSTSNYPRYRPGPHRQLLRFPSVYRAKLLSLKTLRLALKKEELNFIYRESEPLQLNIGYIESTLQVLELDVECGLEIFVDPRHELKSLVLIASGSLTLHDSSLGLEPRSSKLCQPSMTTLKQMYLQSGASLSHMYRAALEGFHARGSHPEMRFLDYVKEEKDGWKVQMPEGFHPGSLHECCCHACPECLARAGVPILCEQGWTSNGFGKYLRRNPSGAI